MADKSTGLVFKTDGMGSTDDQSLQDRVTGTFLTLLDDSGMLPAAICLYTDGVKLGIEGSPVLEQLKKLEARGVTIILCKTCIDVYGLADLVRVGVIGGMPDIIDAMWKADKVITI
jgi:sulfur relay (sulfurtransferase) complex TusBCD TusD component (DsrE family)